MTISYFTTNYSNILNVYGGGGKLFGGTYLILLYLGMLFAELERFIKRNAKIAGILLFAGAVILWWRFEVRDGFALDRKIPFGGGFNPPSVSSITMVLLVAGFVYCLGEIVAERKNRFVQTAAAIWNWLGKHTLYIFLYHRFFLDYVLPHFAAGCSKWPKRFVYFAVMIFGSIAIEYVVRGIKKIGKYYVKECSLAT